MTTGNAKYAVNTGITCAQVTIILSTVFTSDKKRVYEQNDFFFKNTDSMFFTCDM